MKFVRNTRNLCLLNVCLYCAHRKHIHTKKKTKQQQKGKSHGIHCTYKCERFPPDIAKLNLTTQAYNCFVPLQIARRKICVLGQMGLLFVYAEIKPWKRLSAHSFLFFTLYLIYFFLHLWFMLLFLFFILQNVVKAYVCCDVCCCYCYCYVVVFFFLIICLL